MNSKIEIIIEFFIFLIIGIIVIGPVSAETSPKEIPVTYLKIEQDLPVTLSNLDPIPEDLGLQGAALAVSDNNTTGQFLGYKFVLDHHEIPLNDHAAAIEVILQNPARYVLLDASAADIKAIGHNDKVKDRLLFNIRAYDDELRGESCMGNLFHTLPSYQMRTDALMQLILKKRWNKLVLIEGLSPNDALFAAALRKSAQKFQMKFAHDEKWIFDGDMRRHASAEVPLFTQNLGEYDVMFVADEQNDFARYLAYNTWNPAPIMGGDGLKATAWDRVNEQWGAAQLQSRFVEQAGRPMQDVDYAAWAALRAIDEAQIRTQFADLEKTRDYLLNDLELAGFKGRPLSFRQWNGQLRQPIGLTHASAVVAMAPLEGFLHAHNELDSLGQDSPESQCHAFGE